MNNLYHLDKQRQFFILFVSLFISIQLFAQGVKPGKGKNTVAPHTAWTTQAYDYKVFIENRGQCNDALPNQKVLFSSELGRTNAYFTANGVTFRYLEVAPIPQDKDPDEDGPPKNTMHVASAMWLGSAENVSVESLNKQDIYYTYDAGNNKTIKTYVYKKMIYHNLYPGIDAEYTFPEDAALEKKCGIKYSLIVHPGADLSKVKIKYSGVSGSKINENGDVVWTGELGELTDHAPTVYYQGEPQNTVPASYVVNGSEESFSINSGYDKTKTLIIDPWTTSPAFTSPNTAYVMDYDYAGNVYVYGGSGYELVKINNLGARQWMFTASTLASTGPYIGGMCCDKHSECCYMSEGWNASAGGSRQEKVSTNGILLGTDPGNSNMNEIWRLVWDPCTHLVFGSGNGTCCPYQACQIDTNMVTNTIANICAPTVSANGYHDFGCLAVDPLGGSIYTACSQSLSYPTIFNNYLVKCPIPALTPVNYQVPVHYGIHEWSSYHFSGNLTNGFSGAAVSPNWLYMYQGDTLKQINKTTGAINAVAQVSATPYTWGGIDVDYCDDIYLGNSTSVQEYNSSLALVNTYPMTGTIYDVKVNVSAALMYACGVGFVTATTIVPPAAPTIGKTRTSTGCSSCNGTATATLTLCGTPLNSGVAYSWSNGQTTQTVTGLCTGTYSVTVTMGCFLQFTDTVNIQSDSSSGLSVSASQTSGILCNGDTTGSANSAVSGGIAPYTYSWSNGKTTTSISGLGAGSYTITVIDNTGCVGRATVNITQPAQLTATIGSLTNINCNGSSNGSMNVTAGGGTSPYSYNWSNGQTSTSITGLGVGSYTITLTDNNGCSATASANITQPAVLTSSASFLPTACAGNNGSAADTGHGGTSPYSYSWSNGQTSSSATGLSAGTYTVTLTDHNGCSSKDSVTINASAGVNASITASSNLTCNGANNGSASGTASGGTLPYTYSWSSGQTTTNISGLSAGTYTFSVTDNNGCVGTASVNITQPAPLTVNFDSIDNIMCFGNNSGLIKITAAGGTPNYTYNWSNGNTTTNNTGLSAGSYSITVTDANGCSVSASAAITQPAAALNASISPIVNVKCAGTSTGSATVNAGGGTPGYTYSWSNGNTSTNITGLSAGTYSVTVTDNHGCVFTASATITQPAKALKDSIVSTTQIPCHGTTGSITIGATGGTGSYSYSWAPSGGTSTSATGLTAAVYTVTVTDSNGCTANVTDTLKPSTTPIPVISGNDSICKGSQVTLTVTGGGTYLWSPGGSTNSSVTVSPTSTTTYTVHCTNGTCSSDTTFTVIVVPIPSLSFSGNTVICKGSSTPWTASGGTTYTWTPSSGLSCSNCPNPTASPTVTTTYTLQVSNGRCSKDTTIKMTVANKPVSFITQNPTGCICKGSCATLTASGGGSYLWLGGSNQVDSVIHICPTKDSIYSVQVDKVCKDTAKLAVCIDAPNFIVCCDTTIQINGSATLSVVYSSSANVTYSWSPSTGLSCTACPNPVANPTVTTTYTVTMTDSAGCSTATDITVDIACDDFTMPNIFTPNNDGINDDFVPYYYYNGVMYTGIANLSSYSIKIFDRWGVLVYSSTDPKAYWNGRINGTDNLVPDGTYYYMIDATCQNSTYKKKGFVQVLTGK